MAVIEINWSPTRRQLRQFGAAALVVFSALAGLALWRQHVLGIGLSEAGSRVAAIVLGAMAGACGLLALAAPQLLRPLYLGLLVITWPIGYVLSHVIMAVLFYGVFTPVGLIFRAIGRDAMQRRFDRSATTYWVRREPVTDARRYFRQF